LIAFPPYRAKSDNNLTKVIPVEEIEGSQKSGGQITVTSLKAIETALPELNQHEVEIDQYKTVSVRETDRSYLVRFTRMELYSTLQDRLPGKPRDLLVRVEKNTFKVTGSSFW
jgi:hypothetical protein